MSADSVAAQKLSNKAGTTVRQDWNIWLHNSLWSSLWTFAQFLCMTLFYIAQQTSFPFFLKQIQKCPRLFELCRTDFVWDICAFLTYLVHNTAHQPHRARKSQTWSETFFFINTRTQKFLLGNIFCARFCTQQQQTILKNNRSNKNQSYPKKSYFSMTKIMHAVSLWQDQNF